jgi:ketosteroid isomerase-like protein
MLSFRRCLWGVSHLACGWLVLNSALVFGQEKDGRAQDEAALRQASKEYLAAVQRNDSKAMAEFWTPTGVYIDESGQSFKARDLLERSAGSKEAVRPPAKLTATTLRFLTADSATEDGTSEMTTPGKSSPIKGRFSAIWIRQNGKWKLDSLREFRIASESTSERLSELEPLLGEWSGEKGKVTMHVTASWNPTKTFLRRELSMVSGGKIVFTAQQQIGWDPIRQQIRSWVFDGDGGYGEGLWSLEGNVWMVQTRGVHPDGKASQATHIFKFVDRNTLVWKSLNATIDTQAAPDLEMTFARGTKPAPDRASASAPAATSADVAKKAGLLASDTWRNVEAEFKAWAAEQIIYTPQQMEQTKAKLRAEMDKMSAAELQKFLADMDAKLKLLRSKDASSARAWLGPYLSVMADGYRKRFLEDVPDFASMTGPQIEEEYLRLKAKLLSQQQAQASFDAGRTQSVQSALQADAARRAALQSANAASSAQTSNPYQSQYSPKQSSHELAPQTQFWVNSWGHVSYALPGSSF